MFKNLAINACDSITVRDLVDLKNTGHSVYRSSHAGNWNTYKLLFSGLGLPDCIWDVTCMYTDINNQPRHQLIGGKKISLLGPNDPGMPYQGVKYLTPYHRPEQSPEQTLSNFHIQPLRNLFNGVITTQSVELLDYRANLEQVFNVVQEHQPEWLGRTILPCGCMVASTPVGKSRKAKCKHHEVLIPNNQLATSTLGTLEELKRLVFDPRGYETKGGALYSFELVVASHYLWSYWKFGDKTLYELSGPDMIGYATKPGFIRSVEKVLQLVGKYASDLCPETFDIKIVPATYFRFGYPKGCENSRQVMAAHDCVSKIQALKRQYRDIGWMKDSLNAALKPAIDVLEAKSSCWDLFHDPAKDAFYSQHDMYADGRKMEVVPGFLDVSFRDMGHILRTLPQTEASLSRNLLSPVMIHQDKAQSAFGPTEDSFR